MCFPFSWSTDCYLLKRHFFTGQSVRSYTGPEWNTVLPGRFIFPSRRHRPASNFTLAKILVSLKNGFSLRFSRSQNSANCSRVSRPFTDLDFKILEHFNLDWHLLKCRNNFSTDAYIFFYKTAPIETHTHKNDGFWLLFTRTILAIKTFCVRVCCVCIEYSLVHLKNYSRKIFLCPPLWTRPGKQVEAGQFGCLK